MQFTEKEIKKEFALIDADQIKRMKDILEELTQASRDYFSQQTTPIPVHILFRPSNFQLNNMGIKRGEMTRYLKEKGFEIIYSRTGLKHLMHPEDYKKVNIEDIIIAIDHGK